MFWWEILEINKDADLRTIKRAYAAKLKTIRQDENPTEFMALREAYEIAKNWRENSNDGLIKLPQATHLQSNVNTPYKNHPVNLLLDQADNIMLSRKDRNKKEHWEKLFAKLEQLSVNEYTDFETAFIYRMLNNCDTIPKEEATIKTGPRRHTRYQQSIMDKDIACYIFNHFGWNDPHNPIQYNADISNLRETLNAHTELTRDAMIKEIRSREITQVEHEEETNPFWAIAGILWLASMFIKTCSQYYEGQ